MKRVQSPIDLDFSKGLDNLLVDGRNLQKGFPPFRKEGEKEEDVLKKAKDKFVQRVKSYGIAIDDAESKGNTGIYNKDNVDRYLLLKEICYSFQDK